MAQKHFLQTGRAAEIGVYRGEFAAKNLQRWKGDYYAVDAWAWRPGDPGDKNYQEDAANDANMNATRTAVAFAGSRVKMIQSLSVAAAASFPDEYFDWVYVDALHTPQAMHEDLNAWWPKVRKGGLITGDDYGDANPNGTEYMSAHRYQSGLSQLRPSKDVATGSVPYFPENNWGVISATKELAHNKSAPLHVTWLLDCYDFPAWYIVRPPWS